LEAAAAVFDSSFSMRKPEIKASLTYVKLELTKLNSLFKHDAKNPSVAKSGLLQFESASVRPAAESSIDGPLMSTTSKTITRIVGLGVYTPIPISA
jgi:hypothetical protein